MQRRPSIYTFLLSLSIAMLEVCTATSVFGFPGTPVPTPGPRNLFEEMQSAGIFYDFLKSCELANQLELLKKGGPVTVFAPTDSAFAKLAADIRHGVLTEKPKATAFCKRHLAQNILSEEDVRNAPSIETLAGIAVPVDTKNDLQIGSGKIIKIDSKPTNGIIYLLDTVLEPD